MEQDENPSKSYDKKVHGKRYSIAEKLAIRSLKDSNLSVQDVVPLTHANRNTITRIWNDPELEDLSPQVVSKTKDGMKGLFYKRGLQGLLAMTPQKFAESSLLQIATTVGIMTEKGRLMDGLSTSNESHRSVIEHISTSVSKLDSQLEALE
jgi:hypothetical protein